MGGKRLGSFRAGDRSEYLASYALSRFAFVSSIPRQEDFEVVDFLCVLGKEDASCIYPEHGFYVQVKSNTKEVQYDRDAAKWISLHMDLPLILCVIDKESLLFRLYSCWNIWTGLFDNDLPDKLILNLNTNLPLEKPLLDESSGQTVLKVPIGTPIINAPLEQIENNPDLYYAILKDWLAIDKRNIASRAIGRLFVSGYIRWEANICPAESRMPRMNWYFFGNNYERAEADITPILTALAHNYRHNKLDVKLSAVTTMLQQLEPFLDQHGRDFVSEKLKLEK